MTENHGCRGIPVHGTVYGVALYAGENMNGQPQGPLNVDRAPDCAAVPSSPVLFIKPRNTFLASGGTVKIPPAMTEVEAIPALAVVFARDSRRLRAEDALNALYGYTLAIDLSEPVSNMLRPPIQEKCRDGFLPIGPVVVPRQSVADLSGVVIRLAVDGKEAVEFKVGRRFQSIGKVIEAASAFMTFRAGDVLLVTDSPTGPRARAGSRIAASADGIGRLECVLRNEEDLK